MNIDVVMLPAHLRPGELLGRSCAVFDVLRATTTMAAALAGGIAEIRLFADLQAARAAAADCLTPKLLCGERNCVTPEGFDLGNSPGQFLATHRGATLYMCTTNGTKALLAAREAASIHPAAIVNASATAKLLASLNRDVTLLCAGTNNRVAQEDLLGAGAVIHALMQFADLNFESDAAAIAYDLLRCNRHDLGSALRRTAGGKNILQVGLAGDIDFAARLDAIHIAAIAQGDPLTVHLKL